MTKQVRYVKDAEWKNFKNFTKAEFICGCKGKYCNGYPVLPTYSLVDTLQKIRNIYGAMTITSGIRCQKFNDSLAGSVKNSDHLKGLSADILIPYAKKKSFMNILEKNKKAFNIDYYYTNDSNMYNAVHISVFPTYYDPEQEQIADLKKQVETLNKEIVTKNDKILLLEKDNEELRTEVSDLRNKVDNLNERLSEYINASNKEKEPENTLEKENIIIQFIREILKLFKK